MNKPDLKSVEIREVVFGQGVRVVRPVNLYECEIEDGCFIGPFVEIQSGAKIGANTKIQSHSFVCELVSIGKNCFISHGVKFINDTFSSGSPANRDKEKWKKTIVGDEVLIGTNATVLPVEICDRAVIGAGSVVAKDIIQAGIYAGNPAKLIRIL